jgi:hypothetical protein
MMSGSWKEAYEIRNKYQILVGIPDEKGSLHDSDTDGRIIYRPINESQCHDFDVEWLTLTSYSGDTWFKFQPRDRLY